MFCEPSPVNDETEERPARQPVQVECHLEIITVQSVPVAPVLAASIPVNDETQG